MPLEHVEVSLSHSRDHAKDCEHCEDEEPRQIQVIERVLTIRGELDDAQRERLVQIAERCPVHRTLHSELHVRTRLADSGRREQPEGSGPGAK